MTPHRSALLPYTTLFRSVRGGVVLGRVTERPARDTGRADSGPDGDMTELQHTVVGDRESGGAPRVGGARDIEADQGRRTHRDRKSTRLNSSHSSISYAVF